MRYARQNDLYSCGPTAIINILKWSGKKISYKNNLKKYIKKCKTGYHGTYWFNLKFALTQEKNLFIKNQYLTKIEQIMKEINKDSIALIHYEWKDDDDKHYALITDYNNGFFTIINFYAGETVSKIHFKQLKKQIKNIGAIIITRKQF